MTQECDGLQGPVGERKASSPRTQGRRRAPARRAPEDKGMRSFAAAWLPAVVGEGLVRLGHAVDVFLALVRAALVRLGVGELTCEPLGHRLLAPRAGELDEPAD